MNTPQLSPYLAFNGNCREAMEFYQLVLGGKLEISTFGQYGHAKDDEHKNQIMHATLKNDTLSFMASDAADKKINFGDNISMSIAGEDEALLTKFFNGLAEGGKIDIPLAKQVWGDTFGMFTDKFGIHWMINIGSGDAK